MVRTCAGRNPGSTACTCWKLRVSSTAVMSRTVDSAISANTSAVRMRAPPALEPRPPCCSAPRRSRLTACIAGATPTIKLAPSDRASVKKATDGSMAISATRGSVAGAAAMTASINVRATMQPQRTADDAENRGFAKNVSGDTAARGAEGRADRQLLPVSRAPDEEQAGDVRAGHQEDQHDGSEQHAQHRRGPAGHFLVQRHEPDRRVGAMGVGVLVAQPPANPREIVIGLRQGDARFQAGDDPQESLCPVATPRVGGRRVRHDDFGIADERHEIRPQHANDRERFAVQHDRLADGVGGAAESPLPHAMADERRRPLLVVCLQGPAELDLRPGDLEVVSGYPHRGEPLGVSPAGEVRTPAEHRDDAVQRLVGSFEVIDIQQ